MCRVRTIDICVDKRCLDRVDKAYLGRYIVCFFRFKLAVCIQHLSACRTPDKAVRCHYRSRAVKTRLWIFPNFGELDVIGKINRFYRALRLFYNSDCCVACGTMEQANSVYLNGNRFSNVAFGWGVVAASAFEQPVYIPIGVVCRVARLNGNP